MSIEPGPVGGAGELNIELFKKELEKIEWTAEGHCAGADTGSYTAKLWPWLTKQIINAALAAKAQQGASSISKLADEVNQCLQIILINAGNLENGGLVSKERGAIEDAVDRAAKATWAALRGDSNGKP